MKERTEKERNQSKVLGGIRKEYLPYYWPGRERKREEKKQAYKKWKIGS